MPLGRTDPSKDPRKTNKLHRPGDQGCTVLIVYNQDQAKLERKVVFKTVEPASAARESNIVLYLLDGKWSSPVITHLQLYTV